MGISHAAAASDGKSMGKTLRRQKRSSRNSLSAMSCYRSQLVAETCRTRLMGYNRTRTTPNRIGVAGRLPRGLELQAQGFALAVERFPLLVSGSLPPKDE